MNKIHVLIIVRNHSDCGRLQSIVSELNWIAKIIDLNQLSAAMIIRRFDWVVAVGVPLDNSTLTDFLASLEEYYETKSFNVISVHSEMVDIGYDKLKKNWLELSQQFFALSYGSSNTDFELSKALTDGTRSGYMRFQTPMQAQHIAMFLSQLTADSERAYLGLWEVFINAIEHGNLGISYDEKAKMLDDQTLEEITIQRLATQKFQNHYVRVSFVVDEESVSFDIKDDGDGFNWKPFLTIQDASITEKNGRGIAIARTMSFDELAYIENGNRIHCQIRN